MQNASLQRQAENITGIIDDLIDEVNNLEGEIEDLKSELEKRDKKISDLEDVILELQNNSNEY